jgi:hypothetical protein
MKRIVFTIGLISLGVVGKVKADKRVTSLREGTENIHPISEVLKFPSNLPPATITPNNTPREKFLVPNNTIDGVLFINCINLNNDKVNALILDGGGNIVAWFTSKNMRVKNKQIRLDLGFLSAGHYSIRLKAEGIQSVHRFIKK